MPIVFAPAVAEFLRASTQGYDALVAAASQLRERVSPEALLNWIELTAGFAGMHHPGRFFDGALENLALAVGRNLPPPKRAAAAPAIVVAAPNGSAAKRRVLHVASTVHSIGGHTRTIIQWMRKDPSSSHSLVLTAQGQVPIPPGVPEAVLQAGGLLVSLPEQAPIVERARWLRRLAADAADLVIMHLVPNDVVPVVAFAADGPPVGLVNLADQCYWLGATVADAVIHLREIGATSSRELRSIRADALLPIPLTESHPQLDRSAARAALGIPAGQTMLLTVGRSLKYAPSARHNFFRTAAAILDRHPAAQLYLVGVRAEDHRGAKGFVQHERMRFVGPIDDPSIHQRAADVYLEGFPFGSQTALLESVLPGVACVPAHSPATPLLATHDFALDGVVDAPADEAEYVERASRLIGDADLRGALGAELRRRVRHFHIDSDWNDYLQAAYSKLASKTHQSIGIPPAAGSTRSVDLAVAEYHATRLAEREPTLEVRRVLHESITDGAFWLRHRGEFSGALEFLRIVRRLQGADSRASLEALKTYAHWALSRLGSMTSRRQTSAAD